MMEAIAPMAIRSILTPPPMPGIISKRALKGAAIKFQKSVHIVFDFGRANVKIFLY